MNSLPATAILTRLDGARRVTGEAAGHGGVIREFSDDGTWCQIRFSRLSADDAEDVIQAEKDLASARGYELEWKLYSHDTPQDLGERLLGAGFEADDRELVMALPVDEETLAGFDTNGYEVRRVVDEQGLADYAEISHEIGRKRSDEERRRLSASLRTAPQAMSVHVAYVDSEPVAGGRIYFPEGVDCAELAGGRTKTTHRRRGLFTAVVASRLAEAHARARTLVFTDALPTSEPILAKCGFRAVVTTQPFRYTPKP